MTARTIVTRYAGTCGDCGQPIAAGTEAQYGGRGRIACAGCDLERVPAGPTTRERREARADRLRGWADSREAKGTARLEQADRIASVIPFGQPILIGHHSEGRHRRDLDRIQSNTRRGFEDTRKADEMRARADNIEAAAGAAIYSDDPDAVEQLRAKIDRLEAERAAINAYNKAARKGAVTAELLEALAPKWRTRYAERGETIASYATSNLSGNISRLKARLERLERNAQ